MSEIDYKLDFFNSLKEYEKLSSYDDVMFCILYNKNKDGIIMANSDHQYDIAGFFTPETGFIKDDDHREKIEELKRYFYNITLISLKLNPYDAEKFALKLKNL